MLLDNRELASLILIVVGVILLCSSANSRNTLLGAIGNVISAALSRPLIPVWLFFFVYSALIVGLARKIGVWNLELAKDMFLEIVFVGVPSLFAAVEMGSVRMLMKEVVLPELGFGALLGYYITLEVMPLPVELALLIISSAAGMLPVVRRNRDELSVSDETLSLMQALLGLSYVCYTTGTLMLHFAEHDLVSDINAYLLGVWYPVSLIPLLLALSYVSAYESLLFRLRKLCGGQPWRELLGLCIVLFPKLSYVRHFSPIQARDYFELNDASDREAFISDYKQDTIRRMSEERCKYERFATGEGKAGFDGNGLWLDRTMLKEIKQKLEAAESMFSSSAYVGKTLSEYRDMLGLLAPRGSVQDCKLVGDLLICWVSNPTGFTFAIGGHVHQGGWLRYEGERPPSLEDMYQLAGFTSDESMLPNWTYDDIIDKSYL